MQYVIIDTETSGLFDFAKPADAEGQPRMAALGIILLHEDLSVSSEQLYFIKPDGWKMSVEAGAVNRLTDEILAETGVPVAEALNAYAKLVDEGFVIVAFNAQFDTKVLRGEMRRAGIDDRFERTPNICLMRALTDVCRIPKKKGGGFKFPKLAEACAHFKIEQPEAHGALTDARSAMRLLLAMKEAGIPIPEPEVHYAKVKPEVRAP